MRDFSSCFSEYAIQVSDTSCSSYSKTSCIAQNTVPSNQNTVTCLYKAILSSNKQVLITLSWAKNNLTQSLTITFENDPLTSIKLNTNSRLFRKLKGSKILDFNSQKIEAFWDFSTARYETGPVPVDGFYLFLVVDSELSFVLGDLGEDGICKKMKNGLKKAKFSCFLRREYFSGNTLYSTRARFTESGSTHEIVIRCSGENEGFKYPVLSVSIDKRVVIRVKRLQWNFRGNQTVFLDGLLVDLMWDCHDWFFEPGHGSGYGSGSGSGSGSAVFMFRTRSGLDSRLWLEEKLVKKDQEKAEFSLVIYACNKSI